MSTGELWIQGLDHTMDNRGLKNTTEIMTVLGRHDWGDLQRQWSDMGTDADGGCPPGLGVSLSDGSNLHVFLCPPLGESYAVDFDTIIRKKIFGFIPSSKVVNWQLYGITLEKATELFESLLNMSPQDRAAKIQSEG